MGAMYGRNQEQTNKVRNDSYREGWPLDIRLPIGGRGLKKKRENVGGEGKKFGGWHPIWADRKETRER